MKSFTQFLIEAGVYKFSSLQLVMPKPMADTIENLRSHIDVLDLDLNESPDEPHITVLYGIHTEHVQDASLALFNIRNRKPVTVTLRDFSTFDNERHDVLKVSIDSQDLHELNREIRAILPHTSNFPIYVPHLTLAYLKPGLAQKYIRKLPPLNGVTLTFDTIQFSSVNGTRTDIHIGSANIIGSPSQLEIGTSSLVDIYRKNTPGQ
jgi:2'-5' RNA ligase